MLGLIRRYLEAGAMANGVVMEKHEGTPQGGPLSPLLANVLLDEVDKELERRGLSFVRYADDLNVYVGSWRAGTDAMQMLRQLYARLRLRINEDKSAVARPWTRKFLGYSFWVTTPSTIKRRVAPQALEAMKNRVREITARNGGRSMRMVCEELRGIPHRVEGVLPPGGHSEGLPRTRLVGSRHRLRQVQLKQWKRGKSTYRALRRLGANELTARQVAAKTRHWWRTSATLLHTVLNNRYFEQRGVPLLSAP